MKKKKLYRPSEVSIVVLDDKSFNIVDEDLNVICSFGVGDISNLDMEPTKEFMEYLIEYYNHNYK